MRKYLAFMLCAIMLLSSGMWHGLCAKADSGSSQTEDPGSSQSGDATSSQTEEPKRRFFALLSMPRLHL